MAVYHPAVSWERAQDTCRILRSEDRESFTCYVIEVRVSPYKWQVCRRYKQFVELHEKMTKQFAVNKNLLPPKKLIGNRSESFIIERQKALEIYLQTLVHRFSLLPEPLASFLDLQKYEVRAITTTLSEMLFNEGDALISKAEPFKFTPLQLHAFTERLKLGDPTCYSNNPKQDIAHLVEFITQLKHLQILGGSECFEASNIIPNDLSYELSTFKFTEVLEICDCKLENNLVSVGTLRSTLKSIIIRQTLLDLAEFLLCEIIHWSPSTDIQTWPVWQRVTYANFSHNKLTKIHACIKLLPSVQFIDLSHNEIEVIENLESLSDLSVLILSHNKIKDLDSLHTRLGNINFLNLSSNKIKCLHGLSKLFSVSTLKLENNMISLMSELAHLCKLPCLENLSLQNNPVTFTVDYRPQLLLLFNSLASEITLDGRKATEKEIDTVSVLQALKQARQEPSLELNSNPSSELVCQGDESKDDITQRNMLASNVSIPATSCLLKTEDNSTRVSNLNETSKFRQQVETLRKVGGSDWLRLLNEMHSSSNKDTDQQDSKCSNNECAIDDSHFKSQCSLDTSSGKVTSQVLKSITYSNEISHPEWLTFLDSSNHDFKHELVTKYVIGNSLTDLGDTNGALSDLKVFWVVVLNYDDSTICEIPVCILFLKSELCLLRLIGFTTKKMCHKNDYASKRYPIFVFLKSVLASNICSVCFGPCSAYIELKFKVDVKTEDLIILMNKDNANMFVTECKNLYNIKLLSKSNPFVNSTFDVDGMNIDASKCVSKQILFCQRVCVSKVLHNCQHGILHYIFVTPSHVLLVEERLQKPQITELDITVNHKFQICALVSVHTNIKQIHLKDSDSEIDHDYSSNVSSSDQSQVKEDFASENELSILYSCGSWLILEFESNILLCLNFCNIKQRNEFLNAFLGARSQR